MEIAFDAIEYRIQFVRKFRHRALLIQARNVSSATHSVSFDVKACKKDSTIVNKSIVYLDNLAPNETMEREWWAYRWRHSKYIEVSLIRVTAGRASLRPAEIARMGDNAKELPIFIRFDY